MLLMVSRIYDMPIRALFRLPAFPLFSLLAVGALPAGAASDCDAWQSRHPEWIFCDDFDKGGALVASGRYFEYDDNKGDFKPVAGTGLRGSTAMRTAWQAAEVDAGNLKLGFGRAPGPYFSKGIRANEDFREIYYRVFVRMQKGWKGNPYKLSRATVIAKTDWSQAMIAHLWGDRADGLQLDPVRCTDAADAVKCSGYNDFNNMQWIGAKAGPMPIFGGSFDDRWLCVETHVRLNAAGKADGVHEYWIGDTLQARREGLDFLGGYKEYGINGVFFENYWNSASPQNQERYFDDIVVSTQRIGCAEGAEIPSSLSTPGIGRRGSSGPGILRTEGIPTVSVDGETWSITGRKIPQKRGF
jgi:hypothetical protein